MTTWVSYSSNASSAASSSSSQSGCPSSKARVPKPAPAHHYPSQVVAVSIALRAHYHHQLLLLWRHPHLVQSWPGGDFAKVARDTIAEKEQPRGRPSHTTWAYCSPSHASCEDKRQHIWQSCFRASLQAVLLSASLTHWKVSGGLAGRPLGRNTAATIARRLLLKASASRDFSASCSLSRKPAEAERCTPNCSGSCGCVLCQAKMREPQTVQTDGTLLYWAHRVDNPDPLGILSSRGHTCSGSTAIIANHCLTASLNKLHHIRWEDHSPPI